MSTARETLAPTMALVALLGDAETLPLGATAAKFRQAVAPNDRFKAMCSLLLLLEVSHPR